MVSDTCIEVREALPAELLAVGEVTVQAYVSDGLIEPTDGYVEILADASQRAAASGVTVFVAVVHDHSEDAVSSGTKVVSSIAGTITTATADSEYADVAIPGELELRMLAVDPRFRGLGLAARLMTAALELAKESELRAVLCTMPAMESAQRLYARLNLTRLPERDWIIPQAPQRGVMQVYATSA